jgi:hypothetical protein
MCRHRIFAARRPQRRYGYHSYFSPESVVIHPDPAKVIYEAAQYYALIYGTQAPVAAADHTFILVVEISSVLCISKSKRSCAWRDIGFMRDLVKIITDCPNTQLALWTNRSGDGMRQLIKNTVHSITHTMGLPLHRIAFAGLVIGALRQANYVHSHHRAPTPIC